MESLTAIWSSYFVLPIPIFSYAPPEGRSSKTAPSQTSGIHRLMSFGIDTWMGITVPPLKVSCQTTRTDNLYHAFTLFILLGALLSLPLI